MQVSIEKARPTDGAAIVDLLQKNRLPIAGALDHLNTALVARAEGRVVGSAELEVYPDGALLRSVVTDEMLRGRGLGHQITEAAVDLARTLGVPAVYLLTTTAERFFPKFGFTQISRDQVPPGVQQSDEFQSACPSTAIVMRRTLLTEEAHHRG
jgi:amino-acid N-acetyltransferase